MEVERRFHARGFHAPIYCSVLGFGC
uniref:Uncharacterized protein LOC8276725 isoform X1 n=1 Tax=Rhizophora mucronata TaxID=61149 RepID=A0A2P2NY47_RHIMU